MTGIGAGQPVQQAPTPTDKEDKPDPKEARLHPVYACSNQQRWSEEIPRCCNLPFTVVWRPVNQVRTTKNIAEERHCVYLGTKTAESFWLKYFDLAQTVKVQVDASSRGLGACLMQGGQPIQYTSRALTKTEKRYSQIEKEMLSVVYGLTRFHICTWQSTMTINPLLLFWRNLLKIIQ